MSRLRSRTALKRPKRMRKGMFKLADESKSTIRSLPVLRGLGMEERHGPTTMGPETSATRQPLWFSYVALIR